MRRLQSQDFLWKKDLENNLHCCPKCNHHFQLGARTRLEMLLDDGRYEEHDADLVSTDPLQFKDNKSYRDRLKQAERKTGLKDALITGEGQLEGPGPPDRSSSAPPLSCAQVTTTR